MADEVVIRLQAQSAQLEASIGRLEKSLLRLDARAKATNTSMRTGAARTSKSINTQNKSFTLMVAKLALVAFAAQTVANIFQNTFGAILKVIDDFQVAAIGAAAAVTSIANNGESVEDNFTQNLEASLQTFEALELVAARFFSTGQELQLAFNTLAQRGVVIREDEFDILGKLTDQIKLLTGGQNSQIQIQQELRAILDGNVRTTTAFGKSLQARGVDIAQLSREVRATGSIKVFEQFLTGLDAAGGAIRRTLTSVLTTFKSLFAILTRNIFQDTFDDVVAKITEINNFIIENREELIRVGKVIVVNVKGGFDLVVGVIKEIIDLLGDLGTGSVGQLLLVFKAIASVGSTPVRVLLIIATVIGQLTGDFGSVADSIDIFTKSLRVGLALLEEGTSLFTDFGGAIGRLEQGFRGLQNVNLVNQEEEFEEKIAAMTPEERASDRGRFFEAELGRIRERISQNVAAIEQGVEDAGKEAGTKFAAGLGESIKVGLKDLNLQLDEQLKDLGVIDSEERIKKAFDELLKKADALGVKAKVGFTDAGIKTESDDTLERQQIKGLNKIIDRQRKSQDAARADALRLDLAAIDLLAAERKITGLQAFEQRNALRESGAKANIADLREEAQLVRDRADSEERAINARFAADEGPTKITETKKILDLDKNRTDEKLKLESISNKIGKLEQKIGTDAVRDAKTVTSETEKVNRLLLKRKQENDQLIAQTSGDRAVGIELASKTAKEDFASDNLGDTAAINKFNDQQDERDFAAVAAPQIAAFKKAIDDVFNELINGIVEGSFEFRDLAQSISKDLIKSGMEDLIANTKKIVIGGIEDMFKGIGIAASGKAAQALALGIGLMLAVLSRLGNDGDFTASGANGGGGGLQSAAQTRGLIGGSTSLPIAEINNGLMEAMIPTNALLSQIERNTRGTAAAALDLDPLALQDALNNSLNTIFQQAVLQNGP
jgi:hypothetical protein